MYRTKMNGNTKRRVARNFDEDTETLLQQQRLKEKQLLKQWKVNRANEKKIRSIVRSKSRDVRRVEKKRFAEMDESEYDESEDRFIWKHNGCDEACKADNCTQYMLDYLFSDVC